MLFESFEAYNVPEIRKESKVEAKRECLLIVLCEKGDVTDELKARIHAQKEIHILDEWFRIAVKSSSIEEFEMHISTMN